MIGGVRPAVMFGPDDAFLMPLARMLRSLPAFPMFGHGETKLQPTHVDDVAEAIAIAIEQPLSLCFCELGGPRILTYAELLRTIAGRLGTNPMLIPVPFGIWRTLALAAEAQVIRHTEIACILRIECGLRGTVVPTDW